MKFEQIKELITMIDNSKLAYFEIENEDGYVKIDKSMYRNYTSNKVDSNNTNSINENTNFEIVNSKDKSKIDIVNENSSYVDKSKELEDFEFIKSPIVGTFYSKSSPEANPFVKEGDIIHKGDIVCIVEAMKLMNEITAEFDCEIVGIVGQDGKMVEYGENLFKVKRI